MNSLNNYYELSVAYGAETCRHLSAAEVIDGMFAIRVVNMHGLDRFDDEWMTVLCWGSPSINGKILEAAEIARLVESEDVETFAARTDSGFLIVIFDRSRKSLTVITDHMGSRPFFWQKTPDGMIGGTSFKSLFDRSRTAPDPEALFQFLYFRRLFGTRTYSSAIEYLPYAMILEQTPDKCRRKRYWTLTAEETSQLSLDAFSEQLAEALKQSMRLHMSDGRSYGLMLSGGLDARALLAAADGKLTCYTTSPKPNNEVAVAAELAAIAGSPHHYIPRPEQFLNDTLAPSVAIGGGMTIYSEAQFMGYGPAVVHTSDTVFLGLLLDVMFCGHYLPKTLTRFLGRPMWHFKLNPLPDDPVGGFINTASYRLKTSDPWSVIRKDRRNHLEGYLRDVVSAEMDEGKQAGFTGYNLWEFMHVRNVARHYSLQMARSVQAYADCRLPAVNRELYRLCWQMPIAYKYNWRAYQKAIARLNPDMMKVRNANTNIRADMPLEQQSVQKLLLAAARRLSFIKVPSTPAWWDRSWPQARQAIDANPNIKAAVTKLPASEYLGDAGIFDMGGIKGAVDEHIGGKHDHAVLLNLLLTIDAAMRPAG